MLWVLKSMEETRQFSYIKFTVSMYVLGFEVQGRNKGNFSLQLHCFHGVSLFWDSSQSRSHLWTKWTLWGVRFYCILLKTDPAAWSSSTTLTCSFLKLICLIFLRGMMKPLVLLWQKKTIVNDVIHRSRSKKQNVWNAAAKINSIFSSYKNFRTSMLPIILNCNPIPWSL